MLGMLSAKTGTKTLIIDGCLGNQTLTNTLAPGATAGFLDRPTNAALDTIVVTHQASGLHLLPATAKGQRDRDPGIASRSMQEVLEWARPEYGCVIVDLPAITTSVDVWASSFLVDGMIVVVEWGATDRAAVTDALGSLGLTNGQLIGLLLNKADLADDRDESNLVRTLPRDTRARFDRRGSSTSRPPKSARGLL
jgi:succinoglycan biosynthesis transport protein ExoP